VSLIYSEQVIEHIKCVHERPNLSCLIRLVQFKNLQVDRLLGYANASWKHFEVNFDNSSFVQSAPSKVPRGRVTFDTLL
jgi:hypothetical protein